MLIRTTAVFFAAVGLIVGSAWSQTAAPNPTQQPTTLDERQVPVFRVTVVGRTTPAINYRPRSGFTMIDFVGTALAPKAHGQARVEGEGGYIKIDARFDDLPAAGQFGREYLTYVLWAITPEGRATNLGEIQIDNDDARLEVTTELQAFGLVVTAEPYFAVTQPSDVVVLENAIRNRTVGNVETIQARYELLKRGTYLMNEDASRLKIKPLEPGAPMDLAEARNAVELARLAGADRYATDTFAKATRLLGEAEEARERRRNRNAVMMPARQAAQTAEDARLIALQKQEEAFAARERAMILERESVAKQRAEVEEARRREAESARASAERARLDAQMEAERLARERAAAQAESDRLARERATAQAESERLAQERAAAEAARVAAESARTAAESARVTAEADARKAQETAAAAEREKAELRERIREQLNVILETRETARGLIVNLSDVLFDVDKATLKPGAREKLSKVAGVLLTYPGLQIEVEGHTDSTGTNEYNQNLSERRASSVRAYLLQQGITPDAIVARGFGEAQPVTTNDTAAGRQQNRRVELIVAGEIIDTTRTTIRR